MKIRHLLSDALRARILPGDAGTVPDLVAGLRQAQPFERGAFAELLTEFGSVAVPDVVDLLDDAHSELRWWAANVLHDMGCAAIEAGPQLIEKLVDPEESVRIAAALALAALGVAAEQAVPVLAACVGRILAGGLTACYDEECTCADALAALGVYRAAAAPALPEIVRDRASAGGRKPLRLGDSGRNNRKCWPSGRHSGSGLGTNCGAPRDPLSVRGRARQYRSDGVAQLPTASTNRGRRGAYSRHRNARPGSRRTGDDSG